MLGARSAPSFLVAMTLSVPLVLAAAATVEADACPLTVHGRLAAANGPLTQTRWILYDLVHPPGSEAVLPLGDPAANRDNPAKRQLASGYSGADATFETCIAAADSTPVDGTVDLVLAVQAESTAATIHTPGLISGTASQSSGLYVFPIEGEPSFIYTAYSDEHRNAGSGVFDFGTFVASGPGTPLDDPNPPVGPLCLQGRSCPGLCIEGGQCFDNGIPVRVGNPTGAAFSVLANLQRGYRFVADLDARVHPAAPHAPGPVQVYFPQQGCGTGCYGGGTITLMTASLGVVLHEYGHHVQAQFGSAHSPGGYHTCGGGYAPELAWSEGFADFFPAFVFNQSGLALCGDAETSPPASTSGQGDESHVQAALWDLVDDTPGEDPVAGSVERMWDAFTSGPHDYATYRGFHDHYVAAYPSDETGARTVACQDQMAFSWC